MYQRLEQQQHLANSEKCVTIEQLAYKKVVTIKPLNELKM